MPQPQASLDDYHIVSLTSLSSSQTDIVGDLLTEAFEDNAMMRFIEPNDQKRHAKIALLSSKRAWLQRRNAYVLLDQNDKIVGHAVLDPPRDGPQGPSLWELISVGFLSAPFRLGWESFARLNHQLKATTTPAKFKGSWYLQGVLISKEHRGKGLGTAFLRQLCATYVPRDQTVSLSTEVKEKVSFYQRLGYQVVETQAFSDMGYNLWHLQKVQKESCDVLVID